MTSRRAGKRAAGGLSDDDDDGDFSSQPSSRRTKRTRATLSQTPAGVNGHASHNADTDRNDDDDESLVKPDLSSLSGSYSQNMGRENDNDHVTGSVVRVKITNFMTYDDVEFFPGPRLNMILGPNGTGKSSIAAAIAIGLGFPPKIMGRSPELKAYVKQDAEVATLEIELKGNRDKRNWVIWRRFTRDSEQSTFKLNGRSATAKEVSDLMRRIGVQANNLCSFLPQDKVSDFAKMDPPNVLKETMRAAGDPKLTDWHTELSECGIEVKDLESALEGSTRKRDRLQHQVDDLEPEVRQFEARQELEKERDLAECAIHGAGYYAAGVESKEAKADSVQYTSALTAENDKLKPLMALKTYQSNLLRTAATEVDDVSQRVEKSIRAMTAAQAAADTAESHGRKTQADLKSLREKAKRHQQDIRRTEEEIRSQKAVMERTQADKQDVHDRLESCTKALEHLTKNLRSRESKIASTDAKMSTMKQETHIINNDINIRTRKLQELSSIETRKREAAFQLDPSIMFAVKWIEANADKFQAKVLYPPMISVNVPEKQYAWQVEMCTNVGQRKTFIAQNQHDYALLLKLNGQSMPGGRRCTLHLSQVQVTQEAANPARPTTTEQLRALGLDGYAIDYVEADPAVITFLCQNANLHRSAVTSKPGHAINGERVANAGIGTWVTQTDYNRASRSAYGRRDFQFTSSAPTPARAFGLSVDSEAIKSIENEIADLKRRLKDHEQPLQEAKEENEKYRAEAKDIKKERESKKEERERLHRQAHAEQTAHHNLERLNIKLKRLQEKTSSEEERTTLKQKLLKITKERVAALEKFQAASTASIRYTQDLNRHSFAIAQLSANCSHIDEVLDQKTELVRTLQDRIATARARLKKAKENRARHVTFLKAALDAMPGSRDANHEAVMERSKDISVEEAKRRAADARAQWEVALSADPNAVATYKRFKADLDEQITEVDRLQQRLDSATSGITEILEKFNPALDALVQETSVKFSAAFQKIGCTGEVRVSRVEGDYAKWGIEILVSYRDNEDMEVLTASRQSGGERSLATVTYLMSLATMSRTPFSLVDEINQGMDQRAERNVHNQMVEVTCNNAAGQYFLITPKLLTGLNYHPKMKILTVNNGTWIPEPTKQWGRIASCLEKYKAAHAITA